MRPVPRPQSDLHHHRRRRAYDPRFSFDYLTAMAKEYFGIRETRLIYAECLDICGNDPEAILQSAIDQIERSADR